MHKIISKKELNPETCLLEIEAPDIAKAAGAGQFLILRVDEKGEKFPLTVYDKDEERGSISVVCQAVGVSTKKLCSLEENGSVLDVTGPLGHKITVGKEEKVLVIGGGVGIAEAYPIVKLFSDKGSEVEVIAGFRTKELVLCEKELKSICAKVYMTTDDGSYGEKGFVTDVLKDLVEKEKYDLVFAIGPVVMMKAVSEVTLPKGIKTMVSLNSIMIDGTGMCGCCRILCSGEKKFTCVDGPDFDASLVDFEDLMHRVSRYKGKEKEALDHYCRVGLNPPSAGSKK